MKQSILKVMDGMLFYLLCLQGLLALNWQYRDKIYDEAKILIENLDNYLNKIQEKTSSMIHIDLCHSIPILSQRYKLRVVPYEDDYDKIMEVYQSLGTNLIFYWCV